MKGWPCCLAALSRVKQAASLRAPSLPSGFCSSKLCRFQCKPAQRGFQISDWSICFLRFSARACWSPHLPCCQQAPRQPRALPKLSAQAVPAFAALAAARISAQQARYPGVRRRAEPYCIVFLFCAYRLNREYCRKIIMMFLTLYPKYEKADFLLPPI